MTLVKPASLAACARNAGQCAPGFASLWTGLNFALPIVEGSGDPLELVTNTTAIVGAPAWGTTPGGLVGFTDSNDDYWGVGGVAPLAYPLTIAGAFYCLNDIDASGDLLICDTEPATSSVEFYWAGPGWGPGIGALYSPVGDILYAAEGATLAQGVHTMLVTLSGEAGTVHWWVDGVEVAVTVNAPLPALLAGLTQYRLSAFPVGSLSLGSFEWGRVLSGGEVTAWHADPFGFVTLAVAPGAASAGRSRNPRRLALGVL